MSKLLSSILMLIQTQATYDIEGSVGLFAWDIRVIGFRDLRGTSYERITEAFCGYTL